MGGVKKKFLSTFLLLLMMSHPSLQLKILNSRSQSGSNPKDMFDQVQDTSGTRSKTRTKSEPAEEPTKSDSSNATKPSCVCPGYQFLSCRESLQGFKRSDANFGVPKSNVPFVCDENADGDVSIDLPLVEIYRERIKRGVPKNTFIYNFTKDESYLRRWLRASSSDIEMADEQLSDHIVFRENFDIDFINLENWTLYQEKYPIFDDGRDKSGRPFAEVHLSDWNIRDAIYDKRKRYELMRWWTRLLEMHTRALVVADTKKGCYKQGVMVIDVSKLKLRTHACLACMAFYYEMMNFYDANYFDLYAHIIFVNATSHFDNILRVLKEALKQATYKKIEVFKSKWDWGKRLDALVDKSQRTERLDGDRQLPN